MSIPATMVLRGMSLEELAGIPIGAIADGHEARRLREVMEDKRPPTKEEVDRYLDTIARAAYHDPRRGARSEGRQMNYELARIARMARKPRAVRPPPSTVDPLDQKLAKQLKQLQRKHGAD